MNPSLTLRRLVAGTTALAVLAYLGALFNGFAYDDLVLIVGDPGIRSLDGLWERLGQPSWPGAFGLDVGAWRPVTTATWALVWAGFGDSAFAFHALGIVLHAVVTALTVLILAEIAPLLVAGLGGVLFAVHPVHTEAIANVVGSAEPLAATFAFTATLLHLRGGSSYGRLRVAGVTAAYALAVLAKESAAVLPLLLFLLDGAREDVPLSRVADYVRDRLLLFTAMGASLVLILVFRADVVGAVTGATHPMGAEVLRDAPRVWTVFSTWPHYLRLLFFPADLSPDYAPGVVPVVFHWSASALLGAMLGLACLLAAARAWRVAPPVAAGTLSGRLPALGILWIPAAMLPASNVLFLGPVLVAERTLYVASFGACLVGAWLVVALAEVRPGAARGLAIAVVLAALGRTVTRVPEWRDTDTVMGALIEAHPESGTGWLTLGRRLAGEGRHAEALRAYGWGVAFLNSEYRPSTQIATQLLAMGRHDQARFFLRRAWADRPEWYTAPGLLAAAELNAGRPAEAAAAARAATILEPGDANMHQLLAQALGGLNDWETAARARESAIAHGFGDRASSWLLLARDRARAGQADAALAALDSAALRSLTERDVERMDELRDSISVSEPRRP